MRSPEEIQLEILVVEKSIEQAEVSGLDDVASLGESILRCLKWVSGETVPGYGDCLPDISSLGRVQ